MRQILPFIPGARPDLDGWGGQIVVQDPKANSYHLTLNSYHHLGGETYMRTLAIIFNIFCPGMGTMMVGKTGRGITQLLLFLVAGILNFTIVGMVIGIPIGLGVWIWGLVSVVSAPPVPVHVVVTYTNESKSTDVPANVAANTQQQQSHRADVGKQFDASGKNATSLSEPATRVPQPVSTANFCSDCGAAVVDVGSAFCAQCGSKI